MTSKKHVKEEMKAIQDDLGHYFEGTSRKLQTLSLWTLLWPLLPKLPHEPPRAAAELLKKDALETCDICGCPATPTPLQKRNVAASRLVSPDTKKPEGAPGDESPLAKMMGDIEKKMDATLMSIETTTQRTDKLDQEAKELDLAGQSNLTDAELVDTLKSLMKEKSSREERVKTLELKEQQLKESLQTAIDWAKNVDAKKSD